MFLIQRCDGKYLAREGEYHAYTTRLYYARVYRCREDAQRAIGDRVRVLRVVELKDS